MNDASSNRTLTLALGALALVALGIFVYALAVACARRDYGDAAESAAREARASRSADTASVAAAPETALPAPVTADETVTAAPAPAAAATSAATPLLTAAPAPVTDTPAATPETTAPAVAVPADPVPTDPGYPLDTARVRARFRNFAAWDARRRVDEVTAVMGSAFLPREVIELFAAGIRDKASGHLLRNNMANALLAQRHPDPRLERVFWEEFSDPANTPTWRDYALQFYARCAGFSRAPAAIRDNLMSLVDAPGTEFYAGTAVMMLGHEWARGELDLPDDFAARGEKSLIAAPNANLRAAGLSALGRVRAVEKLPTVRAALDNGRNSQERRTAVAVLGEMGTAEDLPRVERHLDSPDRLLAAAARSAAAKIRARDGE